jgi:diguanylate cyclase (GGDEF)-like protein/PAS domain S-box-containing protein
MDDPMTSTPPRPATAPRPSRRARCVRLLLETYIALPLFALVLLVGAWVWTVRFLDGERAAAANAARVASGELADTYEAQLARSLAGIDQTLKVLKYAVELKGAAGALPALRQQGLLPPGLVFVVALADREGKVVASNPELPAPGVAAEPYFIHHRQRDTGAPFISETNSDYGTSAPHLHFTRRINDALGRFAGVAIVKVEPDYFTSAYERSRFGERGLLGLVGDDGVVRALRIGDDVSWGQRVDLAAIADAAMPSTQGQPDADLRYTSTRALHGIPLTAVVGLSGDEQMRRYRQQRRTWLAAAGIGSAVLVSTVALISAWAWQLARARRRVRRAKETYAAASEASLDAFFVLRTVFEGRGKVRDFAVVAVNSRAQQVTGMSGETMQGKLFCDLLPQARSSGIFDDLVRVATEGGVREAEWQATIAPIRGHWLHRQVVPVEGGVVAIVRDITERKLTEERIFHMAHHDELTGLPNRSLLRDRLEQAILHAQRQRNSAAVAFIDLDGFKLINDGLGHGAGDELLKVVGARMQRCLRRNDTLARFGGDEFVILLPDLGDDPLALTPLLDKVRLAVTEPVLVGGQAVQVSCSMGVALYPRDGSDAPTLMMNADAAMYRAKETGNGYQFYAREMNASVEEKLVLLEGLRKALEVAPADDDDGQFRVLYQPKVDLRSGLIFGVEALIRWHHPQHGMIAPQRFIGLAEESGLIVGLGEWVVRTACRQNQAWREAGLPPITVSVNVSARQFEEARLVERIAAALRDTGLEPEALELEVTESLIMRDMARSVERMRELKAMGVALSIDDFGTGYSSLSALKSFPISRLKIDKSFISDLADNPDDQAIAMAVISLAHKLNLRVIAEGVETGEQRDFLRANDCDEMQGYLFSRPVAADAIAALLAAPAAAYL